jgi:hypothetical protein
MVGAFDTDAPVQTLQHYPAVLNVDNVPEDEISQRFQH